MAFCSACGAQVADGSTTCSKCGKSMSQSVGGGAAAAPAPAVQSGGLQTNVAGLLAYLFWIPAIIFLVVEPYNKDKVLRFHSFQSLFLGLATMVIYTVLTVTVIGLLLVPFVGLAHMILAIVAAVKAYQGQKFMIPVIGSIAEKQANG
jgi:uncharacterized membrane protein